MEGILGVDWLPGSADVQNLAFVWMKFDVSGMFPFIFVGDQGHSGECCFHFCYIW